MLVAFAACAVLALAAPASAWAHVANIEYRFPLPVWLYAVAGAIAVLASAPAAAFAVRSRADRTSGNLYPALARLRLGAIGTTVATVLLAILLLSGFFNDRLGFANAAPLLFWVDFWVGLGIVSALLANVWDFVSPLSAAGRIVDRVLARRGLAARAYPQRLGVWPSVALLLVLSWMELVWNDGRDPRWVATLALWYLVGQLFGMAVYGSEVWLARAELFTVVARTLARLAPVELYVAAPAGDCAAARCPSESERIGCPSCWLAADPDGRGVRLRAYGAGIHREPRLGPGGSAFVVTLLATVVYDGLRGTDAYARLDDALVDGFPGLISHDDLRGTATMIVLVGAFAAVFCVVASLVARLERVSFDDAAERYAPTLIPIAAVYFIAHYVLYPFYLGQLTPGVTIDFLGRGWFPEYRPWTGVPGSIVWLIQAGFIVWGHIVAVVEAHRVSLGFNGEVRRAVVAQLPLVVLMIAYTYAGLWVLGQALRAEG